MGLHDFIRRYIVADVGDDIDLDDDWQPVSQPNVSTIVSRSADAVTAILADAKETRAHLETGIADENKAHEIEIERLTEQLRQTNLVIAAFEPVADKLDGYDAATQPSNIVTIAAE